jgi:hypothetical protein
MSYIHIFEVHWQHCSWIGCDSTRMLTQKTFKRYDVSSAVGGCYVQSRDGRIGRLGGSCNAKWYSSSKLTKSKDFSWRSTSFRWKLGNSPSFWQYTGIRIWMNQTYSKSGFGSRSKLYQAISTIRETDLEWVSPTQIRVTSKSLGLGLGSKIGYPKIGLLSTQTNGSQFWLWCTPI